MFAPQSFEEGHYISGDEDISFVSYQSGGIRYMVRPSLKGGEAMCQIMLYG